MESQTAKHYVPFVAPALLQHPTLSDSAKLTASVLLMHRNRTTGLCYATQKIIALERSISDRAVRNDLTELRSYGLVAWQPRKAPRGVGKGRGNLYDLTGLLELCWQPMMTADEMVVDRKQRSDSESDRNQRSARDRKQRSAHASDFRAIADNSLNSVYDASKQRIASEPEPSSIVTAPTVSTEAATIEAGDRKQRSAHSARMAKVGPLKGLKSRQIQERRLAPDGTSAFDVCPETEVWDLARRVVEDYARGEEFNPGDLAKLCDTFGADRVWWHCKWFTRRIASRETPPTKPTAYFIEAVRNDWPINPAWPESPDELLDRVFGPPRSGHDTAEPYNYDEVPF